MNRDHLNKEFDRFKQIWEAEQKEYNGSWTMVFQDYKERLHKVESRCLCLELSLNQPNHQPGERDLRQSVKDMVQRIDAMQSQQATNNDVQMIIGEDQNTSCIDPDQLT